MTDTATIRFGARQQSQGSNVNTWGDDKLNEVLRLFDRGSKGIQSLVLTGDATLSWTNYVATNDGQCAVLLLSGTLFSPANLTVPSKEWVWSLIKNSTGQTITVKTSAGTGIAIPNGRYMSVYCDGADCYNGTPSQIPSAATIAGALTVSGRISGVTAGTASTDAVNKTQMETAIAMAGLPATSGTVLNSASDTTAGYVSQKVNITGVGAASITPSTANPGANEVLTFTVSVGDGGLVDGGLQAASFSASAGSAYRFPTGGTVTLPTPTGSGRKIELSPYGYGVFILSGLISGSSTFILDGNQTITLTDADASMGWV